MTIREIINNTLKCNSDISGIKVAIQNQNELSFMGNPKEIYYGELIGIPDDYINLEIAEIGQILTSSDENRIGVKVLVVEG